MRATGIVRRIDRLGRVVIPIELRRTLEIQEGDPLEIYVTDDGIILRKHHVQCTFCGSREQLEAFREKYVCRRCRLELTRLHG